MNYFVSTATGTVKQGDYIHISLPTRVEVYQIILADPEKRYIAMSVDQSCQSTKLHDSPEKVVAELLEKIKSKDVQVRVCSVKNTSLSVKHAELMDAKAYRENWRRRSK